MKLLYPMQTNLPMRQARKERMTQAAARASALRAILIDGLDERSIEWRIKRQWPKLKDDIPSIITSAQRTAEKWKPGEIRTIGGMKKRITSIDEMNERFVMIEVPGQPTCVAQRSDAFFMTKDDFKTRMGTSVIVTGVTNKAVVQAHDAAKVWMGDSRRRKANKVVFTSREVGSECFNLWTDFGVAAKAGCCDLIHKHIKEVICANDPGKYKAFINLLAWQVQNIGTASRIIVVLFSEEQQIGKGALIEKILPEMFGLLHGVFTDEFEHYFGKFNDGMKGKACVCLDEACFAGDKKAADKIKSAAATGKMSIEAKGLPKIQLPVGVNIYMATNHPHAAHVEKHDARYWILKVSPHRKGDVDYWNDLFKEINGGGIAAFLSDLLVRDISNFVPQRDVPLDNAEHRANKRASDPANPVLWLLDCLDNGLWLGSEKYGGKYGSEVAKTDTGHKPGKLTLIKTAADGAVEMYHSKEDDGSEEYGNKEESSGKWETRLLPTFLENSYREWAVKRGRHAQAASAGDFWDCLTKFGFASRKSGERYRTIPTEAELRVSLTSVDWV